MDWRNAVLGVILIAAGIATWRYRKAIAKRTLEMQKSVYGSRVAKEVDRWNAALWAGIVGIFGIVLGFVAILLGVLRK